MRPTSLKALVEEHIEDGQTLYFGGFSHLIPFAAGHEVIRQGRRDLTLARATPDLLFDQMIAAGVAKKLVFSYAGNPGVGLLPCFRRAVERGALELEEYSHYEMMSRLEAGATGLPFWPLRTIENDLTRRRGRPSVACPFTGEAVPVVAALRPDVSFVHAHWADEDGNIYMEGLRGDLPEAAFAARKVLVTVEAVRPEGELRPHPHKLLLPSFRVDGLAVVPFGAHPSYVYGLYGRDSAFYRQWDELARDEAALASWIKAWILDTKDHGAYVRRLGKERLSELRRLGEAVGAC